MYYRLSIRYLAFCRSLLLLIICSIVSTEAFSQATYQENKVSDTIVRGTLLPCGTTPAFLYSLCSGTSNNLMGNMVSLGQFPSQAIYSCSNAPHFRLYVEDLIPGNPAAGFADPVAGATRLTTFCKVLEYLENTLNFSNVPINAPIRIYVLQSFSSSFPANGAGYFAAGGAIFSNVSNALMNGDVHDYAVSGVDPNPGGYHATIRVNFDQVTNAFNQTFPISYNNGLGNPANCELDLYSTLLHEMGHVLGFASFIQYTNSVPSLTNGHYTSLDNSVYVGVNPSSALTKLISGGTVNSGVNVANNYWVNNALPPNNHPLYSGSNYINIPPLVSSFISHFDDYLVSYPQRLRLSPGNRQPYVMVPFGARGIMRRSYTKAEIKAFTNSLGYALTSAYAAANATVLSNTPPYSTRMASYNTYPLNYPKNAQSIFPECVTPDFPDLINNGTNTLTFYLANDNTIVDVDNDQVYAEAASIVNFRGCGNSQGTNGGNNHDQLTPIYGGALNGVIGFTYTPRPGFVGRAQFGFSLTDGKEKGSFVLYTINVVKNPSATIPAGSELVLNGGFEEGTEVKKLGTNELVQNATIDEDFTREGMFNIGAYFADSHPFDWYTNPWEPYGSGIVINNSNIPCAQASTITWNAGNNSNSFPGLYPYFLPGANILYPASNTNPSGGNRYQNFAAYAAGFYYLADQVKHCKRYTLKFDAYAPIPITNLPIDIGFTDATHVTCNTNFSNFFNTTMNYQIPGIKFDLSNPGTLSISNTWTTYTIDFYYCGTTPSDILYIHPHGGIGNFTQNFLIDNISLKENATVSTFAITQTPMVACQSVQLSIPPMIPECGGNTTYSWSPTTGLNDPTLPNPIATNPGGGVNSIHYTCTVTAGCQTLQASTDVYWWNDESSWISSASNNFCNPFNTLTAHPSDPSFTYLWTGPGITSANNINPITINQSGTYGVTITAPTGCTLHPSLSVGTFNSHCCNSTIEGNPNTIMLTGNASNALASIPSAYISVSGGTTTISNYPYYLLFDGMFIIDQNVSFVNCPNMVFHPNTWMQVANNRTLSITNGCVLQAACNEMWEGIWNTTGGTVVIDGSVLRDMNSGVWNQVTGLIHCTNSIFENNFIGIHFQTTPPNYAGTVYGNTFKSTGNYCLSPHAGQKGAYGVVADWNCQSVTVGDNSPGKGNTFDNLKTGIAISLANAPTNASYNFAIRNNTFTNIQGGSYGMFNPGNPPISLYKDYVGTAVYADAVGSPVNASVEVSYPSQGSTANFNNCSKGITTNGFATTVQYTKLSNTLWAINLSRTEQYNYTIKHNTLTNVFYGINFNGDTKSASVSHNSISSASQSTTFNNLVLLNPTAIDVGYFTPGTNFQFITDFNGISMNMPGGIGISVRNAGIKIANNTIALTSGGATSSLQKLYGIYVTNATGAVINCNTVSGNTALVSATRPDAAGVYMSDSRYMDLVCNNVNLEKYGFQVIGNCLTNRNSVRANTFSNHINGWLFRHLGSPGTFGDVGDLQNDNNNQFLGTMYGYQNGFLMKVYRVSNCISPSFDKIFTSNGTLTNNESGGNNVNCKYQVLGNNTPHSTASCDLNCNIGKDFPIAIADIELAEKIAQDSVLYSEYQEGASWLAAQRLYYDLYYDTAARNSSIVLDSFFLAMQNAPIGNLKVTDDLLRSANETFWQDTSAYYEWLQQAKDANDDMVSSDQQALNEQAINDLYLKYLRFGVDSLTAADSATIAGLALQCPMVGGVAVYKARTMYALYVNLNYDDLDICNNQGYYKGSHGLFDEENAGLSMQYLPSTAQKHISIYPNPNSGRFTIQYMLEQGEEGKVQITDLQGRLIEEVVLSPMLSFQQMDLSKQANGIYFYRFVVNGLTRYSGKIEVIK